MLALVTKFLEEFFTGPQSGEFNPNVLVGREPRKPDQLSRQVNNFDRLAHVEGEYFTTGTERGALQHQSYRFRDRHEIPRNLRMGYGDGPARGNLFIEDRDHAAGGSQHVPKPDRHEAGGLRALTVK